MVSIPVIDLFAGPGGLGEGFSALKINNKKHPFKIALSIEKDVIAHKTLELRSFFRQFREQDVPFEYYLYLQDKISREQLFLRFPREAKAASNEAWLAELGKVPSKKVDSRIRNALISAKKWVLIGGPPCQVYSIVGRVCMRGKNPSAFEKDHRHFLYKEYLKIIRDYKPPVFVMENVKGILSSKMSGSYIIDRILDDLSSPSKAFGGSESLKYDIYSIVKDHNGSGGYDKRDYTVECEKHGLPQKRHRVILLGVRSDIGIKPNLLEESPVEVKMWDVIGDLPKIRSGITDMYDNEGNWIKAILEIKDYSWFKNDELNAELRKQLSRIKRSLDLGNEFQLCRASPKIYRNWFVDNKLNGVCNHSARKHIKKDLHRYFYAACYAANHQESPKIKDFPKEIWPDHSNVREASIGRMFSDRFRVQLKNRPSTTVISHIAKDGHYFIHPDPTQCRSLTVREAARLQTFPDNYFFEGTRTAQYGQVGNAVPPLLATKIAKMVYEIISQY